jgi:solute carrier family 25 S-adenosylmethionine transporter 26
VPPNSVVYIATLELRPFFLSPKVYEFLKKRAKEQPGHSRLSALESALLGSGASLVAQVLTTPLDVVRTRIMTQRAEDPQYTGILDACKNITKEEGASALLSGTIPRALRSVLSGAIQFSTYEFTKQLFGIEIKK